MKKDILIIAHFCGDFDGSTNNRFNYLANKLSNNHFNVELTTSDFSHNKKRKRDAVNQELFNYKITFINEPVYQRNVSLRRFYSHYIMSKNLKKYLRGRKKPDIVYCAVPSLDVAEVASKYCAESNIKFIIDVQDLWPEAFKLAFKIPIISDIIFYPMKRTADSIYSSADAIIAVSDTYNKRAFKVNSNVEEGTTVYLGTDLQEFDNIAKMREFKNKPENEIWIAYIGTLGHSYNLTFAIEALAILEKSHINNIKFIVMGDGPLKTKFENYANEKKINCEFTGRLAYNEMVNILCACDIAINPISKGSVSSIINKHADYAAAGLPVLNTQECVEYRNLVDDYKMGFNCDNEDHNDLAQKLLILSKDANLRKAMGLNSRKLAEDRFDRMKSYENIINSISCFVNTSF